MVQKTIHINALETANSNGNTLRVLVSLITIYISSRFSTNSEAFASEFAENLEEMFPWYCIHDNELGKFKSSSTQ